RCHDRTRSARLRARVADEAVSGDRSHNRGEWESDETVYASRRTGCEPDPRIKQRPGACPRQHVCRPGERRKVVSAYAACSIEKQEVAPWSQHADDGACRSRRSRLTACHCMGPAINALPTRSFIPGSRTPTAE